MNLQIKKFGDFLTSRPAGREAALNCLAYDQGIENTDSVNIDFEGVIVMTPSWLGEFVQTLQDKGIANVNFMPSNNPTVISSIEFIELEIKR